ncbi:MAG: Ig-like domain-containing protein, partial [Myxococcota bacterium]|nr:Ig-like domain-containing protein [Myxococcota bacterium]
ETAFSARVEYADGTESACSAAAVFVRRSAHIALAAWWVDPDDPAHAATSLDRRGNTPTHTIRVAVTAAVTDVRLFADATRTSTTMATRVTDAGANDLTINLVADLGVTLPTDAELEVPVSVLAEDDTGQASECLTVLTYTHDPIPPTPPILEVAAAVDDSGQVHVQGSAEEGATVTVFQGAGCDPCTPVQSTHASTEAESPGLFEVFFEATEESASYSAIATDAAGNVSACAESTTTEP